MHSYDFRKEVPQALPVLNEKQIAVIAEFAERKTYADGDVLYRAGEKDFRFYVIKSGAIEMVDRSSGESRPIITLEPGEFTGDLANLTGRPSNVDAIVKGTTEVYEIGKEDLRRIIGKRPGLSDLILRTFIIRAQSFVRRILAKLSKAGLVSMTTGKSSSCVLARKPEDISLLDIYKAVDAPQTFAIHDYPVQGSRRVSCNTESVMQKVLERAQNSFEGSLGVTSLAELIADTKCG